MWVPYIYILCNINSLFHWKFLNCFPNHIMQHFQVWNEQIVGEKGDWKPQKNRWPVLPMPPLQAYEKPDATSAGRLSAEVLKRWRAKKTSWASALLGRKKRHRTSDEGAVSEGQPAMEGGSMYCNCLTFPSILMDCNLLSFLFFFHLIIETLLLADSVQGLCNLCFKEMTTRLLDTHHQLSTIQTYTKSDLECSGEKNLRMVWCSPMNSDSASRIFVFSVSSCVV